MFPKIDKNYFFHCITNSVKYIFYDTVPTLQAIFLLPTLRLTNRQLRAIFARKLNYRFREKLKKLFYSSVFNSSFRIILQQYAIIEQIFWADIWLARLTGSRGNRLSILLVSNFVTGKNGTVKLAGPELFVVNFFEANIANGDMVAYIIAHNDAFSTK